jgi:hypothetical protein
MFNLQDYETVESRLQKFITDFPDFRISTELESFANDRFIVKAYIYRTYMDAVAFSTGLAEEKITDRGVNSTSALENCETSAIGRALANAGYATKGKRASREEMDKVQRLSKPAPTVKESTDDLWLTETYTSVMGTATQEPKPGLDAAALIQSELGGELVETCKHGTRLLKEGTSKTGKPYKGYVCGVTVPGQQCKAIWYLLSPTGGFIRPKEAGDE